MRFTHQTPLPLGRAEFLSKTDGRSIYTLINEAGPHVGLRTRDQIKDRVETLQNDQVQPPLSSEQADIIHRILGLNEKAGQALISLREIQDQMPSIEASLDRLEARLDALAKQDVDIDMLDFQGNYGLDAMEYYDGFVFGFTINRKLVANGGRYDALTAVLGNGASIPAVGGIIHPSLVLSTFEEGL